MWVQDEGLGEEPGEEMARSLKNVICSCSWMRSVHLVNRLTGCSIHHVESHPWHAAPPRRMCPSHMRITNRAPNDLNGLG